MRFVALVSTVLVACTPPREPPSEGRTAPPEQVTTEAPGSRAEFKPGPLRVEPPLPAELEGWAGISLFENLISSGFSADSKLFASCHAEQTKVFGKACELLDRDDHVARRVVSSVDYGDGRPSTSDPELNRVLAPLGVPAAQAPFRYAEDLSLVWVRPNPSEVRFALREATTRVETPLAVFQRSDRREVIPQRVVISPDGRRLAIVVYVVAGPPLTTAARIVELDRAASEAYARAGKSASSKAALSRE
jgi:hypothetical protein